MAKSTVGKSPTTKRKTTTTRKPSSKRTTAAKKKQADKPLSNDLRYELVVLLFIAFSLMLIISIYFNIGGKVGETVRYALFGAFGVSAYILPIYILGASFIKIFNRDNARLNNKLSLVFIAIIMVSTFAHVLYIEDAQINKVILEKNTFFATTALYFEVSAKTHLAGGMIGGVVGDFFEILIGRVGSFIILVLIFLSLGILITEQSLAKLGNAILAFFKWIGHGIGAAFASMSTKIKKDMAASKEQKEAEERQQIEGTQSPVKDYAPKTRKKGINFLERVTLKLSQGEEPVEPAEEAVEAKPKKRKSYKVNGVDPFKQIVAQEEKALAKQSEADKIKPEPISQAVMTQITYDDLPVCHPLN